MVKLEWRLLTIISAMVTLKPIDPLPKQSIN